MAAIRAIRPIQVTLAEKAVLWALADRADDSFEAYPSIAYLMEATCLSERGVQKAVAGLKAAGLVVTEVGGGRHRTTLYRLTLGDKTPHHVRGNEAEPKPETPHLVQETPHTVRETPNVVRQTPHRVHPTPQDTNLSLKEPKKEAREVVVELPSWMPADLWADFEAHRKSIRKPLTERAVSLSLKQLGEWRQKGHDPRTVIERTIANGWTGLFEPPVTRTAGPNAQPEFRNGFYAVAKKMFADGEPEPEPEKPAGNPFLALRGPNVH